VTFRILIASERIYHSQHFTPYQTSGAVGKNGIFVSDNCLTRGSHSFVGSDRKPRRDVVVRANSAQPVEAIRWRLLAVNAGKQSPAATWLMV